MVCHDTSSSPRWYYTISFGRWWCHVGVVNQKSWHLFRRHMDMTTHIKRLVWASFYQLRRIRAIRPSIPTSTAIRLFNSFIVTKIDYCNSLLAGLPAYQVEKVQSILNYAARLIYGRRKYDHVTPLLCDDLHWLRVPHRVHYKSCLLVYKAMNGLSLSYITSYCRSVSSVQGWSTLRSAAHKQLVIPRSKTKLGDRSFSVAGPSAWNNLPNFIKTSTSVEQFKSRLNTYLFKESYSQWLSLYYSALVFDIVHVYGNLNIVLILLHNFSYTSYRTKRKPFKIFIIIFVVGNWVDTW